MWNLNYVIRNVNDMYQYCLQNNLKLLSDYSAPFWNEYNSNSEEYDRIFNRMFKTFHYFDQDISNDNPVSSVTEEFINAVKDFLLINNKRFTELYKLHIEQFLGNPYYNQYIVQTRTGYRNLDSTYNSGERTDTSDITYGSRTDISVGQQMAYNSNTFVDVSKDTVTKGSETDESTAQKGEQTDVQDVDETSGHTITMQGATGNIVENARRYKDMWSGYEFYTYIFKEICKELLLIE